MLEVNGLADSIDYIKFENINAQNSKKKDLEFFFSVLLENDSKIIGGSYQMIIFTTNKKGLR